MKFLFNSNIGIIFIYFSLRKKRILYNICQLQSIVADKNDYLCTMDMRNKTFYILALFLVLSSFFNLSAQSRMTVTGFVVDSLTNERMEFITIQEKGTTNGTITDTEGQVSSTVKPWSLSSST